MTAARDITDYLRDILEATEKARQFVAGVLPEFHAEVQHVLEKLESRGGREL